MAAKKPQVDWKRVAIALLQTYHANPRSDGRYVTDGYGRAGEFNASFEWFDMSGDPVIRITERKCSKCGAVKK